MEFCFLHVYWWNWASQRWQPAGNTTATVTMVFVLSTLSDCTEMWRRVPLFCSTVGNSFKTSVPQHMLVWSGLFAAMFSPLPAVQVLMCFSICCTSSWGELLSLKITQNAQTCQLLPGQLVMNLFITILEPGLGSAREWSRFALSSGTYDLANVWIHSTLCKLIAFIFELLERSICSDVSCSVKERLWAVTFQTKKLSKIIKCNSGSVDKAMNLLTVVSCPLVFSKLDPLNWSPVIL